MNLRSPPVSADDILAAPILIVDDKAANLTILAEMLSSAGYHNVTSVSDPALVVELYRLHRYTLIVLDLLMPGMDGFKVMSDLKAIETEGYLPVLVQTAQPMLKLRALQAGAKDFVSKPFDLAELLVRVRNMIEIRLLSSASKTLYTALLDELLRRAGTASP